MFLGPRMVATAFSAHFVSAGTTFYSYPVLFTAFMADFSATRLEVSTGMILCQVGVAVCSVGSGILMDHRPIGRVMALGALLLGAGFAAAAVSTSLWTFYLAQALLIGAGSSMFGNFAPSALVSRWYDRHRGTALGIAQLGISASGMLLASAVAWLVAQIGWRGTYALFAGISAAVMAPLMLRAVVGRPGDVGQRPDGDAPVAVPGTAPAPRLAPPDLWNAPLRQRVFWVIAVAIGLAMCVNGGVILHLPAYVETRGLEPVMGGVAVSLTAAAAMLSKPVYGRLFDRLDPRVAPSLMPLLQISGIALLLTSDSPPALLLSAAIFGLGLGGTAPLLGALVAAAFGPERFGRVSGLLSPLMLPLNLGGMALSGALADRTGSYALSLQIMAGAALVSLLAIQMYRAAPAPSSNAGPA